MSNQIRESVNFQQARDLVKHCMSVGVVPLLHGSPSTGKSSIARELAKEMNLKLIDLRLGECEPTDLLGLPFIQNGRASYNPMKHFPLEGDEIPKGYSGWLLFFDELTSADRSVQKASYRVILDRKIDQTPLHDKCFIMAAGNRTDDNAIVEEMSTALQSRMVHFDVELPLDSWLDWAYSADIDSRVLSFVQSAPGMFNDFSPEHDGHTYACPRTWEFLSKLIKGNDVKRESQLARAMVYGTVGVRAGVEFLTFLKHGQELPTLDEVVRDPMTARLPDSKGGHYMVTINLSGAADPDNLKQICQYVDRLDPEFAIVLSRALVARHDQNSPLRASPVWREYVVKTGKKIREATQD